MGQTPSNGNVENELPTIYYTMITISVSHETFHYTLIILARANTSENNTLPKGVLYCYLVPFGSFLGNNHSQISGFWGWVWWQRYVSSLDCWSWWSEMGTDLSWSTLCCLEQGKNYGDLQYRYFFPTGFCYLLVWFWYFHNSDLGRPQEEQHKEGRTQSEVSFNHQTRTLGCISSQKDGTYQSQCVQ